MLQEGPVELIIRVMRNIILLKQNKVYVNSQMINHLPYGNSDFYIKKSSDFFYKISGLKSFFF